MSDDVFERYVADMRTVPAAPAPVVAHFLRFDTGEGMVHPPEPEGHVFPGVGEAGLRLQHIPRGCDAGIVNLQEEARLDDRPVLVAHGVGERVDEFLVGTVVLVVDEVVEPSGCQRGDKSLVKGDARAHDRRLEAVELALRRCGASRLEGPVDDDALARRRARPLAWYAGDGADAVHVGIEGTE